MRTPSVPRQLLTAIALVFVLLAQGCANLGEAQQGANDLLAAATATTPADEAAAPQADARAARTAADLATAAQQTADDETAADQPAAADTADAAAGGQPAPEESKEPAPSKRTAAATAETGGPSPGAQFQEWNVPDGERERVLGLLAAAGMEWLRIDVGWRSFELRCDDCYSKWYIDRVDTLVADARRHGMDVLLTVHETPEWANGGDKLAPPSDPSKLTDFMRWLSEHYRGRVIGYEIWNEPNVEGYFHGNAADYVKVLKAAYRGVKAGDPDGTVVFGGPSFQDAKYIADAYAAGAGGHFDVMATHPYQGGSDAPPDHETDGKPWWITEQPSVTDVMRANGDGDKEVWWTEFGWSTRANKGGEPSWRRGVTEAEQGEYLVGALQLAGERYPEVTRASWYTSVEIAEADPFTRGYALIRRDMTAKPALDALRRYTRGG